MRSLTFCCLAIGFVSFGAALARIIHVPGEYPTIQAGIDAANPGDIVRVAPGRYPEEIVLKAGVVVRGAGAGRSTIDGQNDPGDVVRAIGNAISNSTRLEGFTITGALNSGGMPGGGGVFCNSGAAPVISNCRIQGNDCGVACWNGSEARVENCLIVHNVYDGVSVGAAATVVNNTIHNCRIGFYDYSGYGPVFMNNVVTGCALYGVYGPSGGSPPVLTYNDVWGNATNYQQAVPGVGSISRDPMYVDTAAGDFHLAPGSPCIDSGNPAPQYNDPDGTRNDMGAYGGPGAATNRPQVVTVAPGRNELEAEPNAEVAAGFNVGMEWASVSGRTFRVNGAISGPHFGTVSFDTVANLATLDPEADFLVGEPVSVCLGRQVVSALGDSLGGYSWPFRIRAEGGSGRYGIPVEYGVGPEPFQVVAADFDRDGSVDLAVTNEGSDSVSVLLGNGDGTFRDAVQYRAGITTYGLGAADFDRDSVLDLAVAADSVAVLLGNGDGTFGPPVRTWATGSAFSLCAADFNADGETDLGVGIPLPQARLQVLLGNGDGTFNVGVSKLLGAAPLSVEAADVNNDGKTDLLAAANTAGIAVLVGDGDGGFEEPVYYNSGPGCGAVAGGDFNADGWLDLATTECTTGRVAVLLNDRAGGFGAATRFPTDSGPSWVVTADCNGDGRLDLVTANRLSDNVSVLLGRGNGSFLPRAEYLAGAGPRSVAYADFDGDSDIDLASANRDGDDVSVLLNTDALEVVSTMPEQHGQAAPETTAVAATFSAQVNPATLDSTTFRVWGEQSGFARCALSYDSATMTARLVPEQSLLPGERAASMLANRIAGRNGVPLSGFGWGFTVQVRSPSSAEFGPHTFYPAGEQVRGAWAGDFDRDGDVDLALTSNSPAAVALLRNNGNGTFAAPVFTGVNSDPIALFGADLDADYDLDLAVFHNQPGTSQLEILKNDGSGNLTVYADYAPAILGQHLSGGDFDADGDVDLVLSDGWGSQDNVRVMFNNGSGGFTGPVNYSAGSHARGAGVTDIDNDGDFDMLIANGGNENLSVLLNDGSGLFPALANYSMNGYPHQVYANDFNADGWVDVAATHYGGASVDVLLNQGDGRLAAAVQYATEVNTKAICGSDFDGDSDVDLAMSSSSADTVAVLLGNGDGTFENLGLYPVGELPWDIVTADFNLDGAVDLAVADYNAGSVSVLLATGLGVAGRFGLSPTGPRLVVRPSVFSGSTHIACQAALGGLISLRVCDAAGRVVRDLSESVRSSRGSTPLVWDGRDQSGTLVAPGVYFARLDAAGTAEASKMILTR